MSSFQIRFEVINYYKMYLTAPRIRNFKARLQPYEGILKASCYVSVAIATELVVMQITEFKSRNINLSLLTSICQMKFKYAKSDCQTAGNPNFLKTVSNQQLK